jgi:dienelactone hydrolase
MPRRIVLVALAFLCLSPAGATAGGMTMVPATGRTDAVPVYVAQPLGKGPFPAVLLLHGCDGFNGFGAVAADRLAAHGYVAVALDSLGVLDPFAGCVDNDDGASNEAADARVTLDWMRAQPYVVGDRLAVMGFSMGGTAVLNLIDPPRPGPAPKGLRAAIAFYPLCDGHDGSVTVPLRIFDGDADEITPAAPCAAMVKAGKAAGKPLDITVYPGATHAFQVPGPDDRTFFGQPIRFDAEATADSALQVAAFLAESLK